MKKLIVAGIAIVVAGQVFAGMSEGSKTVTWSNGSPSGYSVEDSLLQGLKSAGHQVLYGRLPLVYKVLGLTDEQAQAIKDLCKAAQKENSALYKSVRQKSGRRMTSEQYKEKYKAIGEQRARLIEKYEARVADVLTAKQKAALAKLKALGEEKALEDKEVGDKYRAQVEKLREKYRAKLKGMLTPAQMALLKKNSTIKARGHYGISPQGGTTVHLQQGTR